MHYPQIQQSETYPWGGHTFSIHQIDDRWNHIGGVYVFAHRRTLLTWAPIYIGETEDFAERFRTHERWRDAVRLGATDVHAIVETGRLSREQLERTLIVKYMPPLNFQHRVGLLSDLFKR